MKDDIIKSEDIQNKIFTIRDQQVMIDRDLAEMYGVKTKVLNQAVKRNTERFPDDFMFRLTKNELADWRSQFVTSNQDKMGLRRPPYVFTEQGVSMLSAILRSDIAVEVSVRIIRSFVNMRKFISTNASVFNRLSNLEQKQIKSDIKQIETDTKIDQVLNALEANDINQKQNIFYDGQVFDAYNLIADIIRKANKSIIIIDNYIDDTVFKQLAKRKKGVTVTIFTKSLDKTTKQDLQKYHKQYPKIEVKKLTTSHDRFMIIDKKIIYHFGASLKDAGKKWFAFSRLDMDAKDILEKLNMI